MSSDVESLRAELELLRAERDRLAAQLADQQEQLRVAFDHAPAAIALVSIADGRLVYVNNAFCEFFGWPRDEVMGTDPIQLMTEQTYPDDLHADLELYQRLADGEISGYQLEKRYLSKSGDVRWGLLSLAGARDAQGRLSYVIAYISDIHELKTAAEARARLEDRLRQAQKLEALGQLAGGIAHDFNNRLVVVLGYVELLRHDLPADSPLAEYAEQILVGAQRSAELTQQLLAFSRHQVLCPKSLDVHETVDGMRRMLQRLLGERVELVTVFGAKRAVFCDPGQLEQVIMNLAVNARDAMPQGGRLTFETRDAATPPDDLRPGDYLELRVTDTGTGIADDLLPRVFEPFFTTKAATGGTGLGLATVDGIVRQSGGAVSVSSDVGLGSTFTVYLPAARPDQAPKPDKIVPARVLRGRAETVLVCDDDAGARRLMLEVLRLGGYQVLEARDGEHAVEVARTAAVPIDLLVTDVVMPRLDGPQLARRLRAADATLPVLFVSGWAESESAREAVQAEGRFLAKPFLPGDLLRNVHAVIGARAAEASVSRSGRG